MKFCAFCGRQLEDKDKFCLMCGEACIEFIDDLPMPQIEENGKPEEKEVAPSKEEIKEETTIIEEPVEEELAEEEKVEETKEEPVQEETPIEEEQIEEPVQEIIEEVIEDEEVKVEPTLEVVEETKKEPTPEVIEEEEVKAESTLEIVEETKEEPTPEVIEEPEEEVKEEEPIKEEPIPEKKEEKTVEEPVKEEKAPEVDQSIEEAVELFMYGHDSSKEDFEKEALQATQEFGDKKELLFVPILTILLAVAGALAYMLFKDAIGLPMLIIAGALELVLFVIAIILIANKKIGKFTKWGAIISILIGVGLILLIIITYLSIMPGGN